MPWAWPTQPLPGSGACAGSASAGGLRVESADGWWLLRASGTEPKLTLRCEGRDAEALVRVKAALGEALAAAGLQVDLG